MGMGPDDDQLHKLIEVLYGQRTERATENRDVNFMVPYKGARRFFFFLLTTLNAKREDIDRFLEIYK